MFSERSVTQRQRSVSWCSGAVNCEDKYYKKCTVIACWVITGLGALPRPATVNLRTVQSAVSWSPLHNNKPTGSEGARPLLWSEKHSSPRSPQQYFDFYNNKRRNQNHSFWKKFVTFIECYIIYCTHNFTLKIFYIGHHILIHFLSKYQTYLGRKTLTFLRLEYFYKI